MNLYKVKEYCVDIVLYTFARCMKEVENNFSHLTNMLVKYMYFFNQCHLFSGKKIGTQLS